MNTDVKIDTASVQAVPASALHSVAARAPLRDRLAADVAAFLAHGGRIVEVPRDLRVDLPRRPDSDYGRGAI